MMNFKKLFCGVIYLVSIVLIANSCKKTEESVIKKDPVITWANPVDIPVETLLSATQLNAKADVAGTFVYTPTIGTKLNVVASQDLKVDFTPTDAVNYSTVSKTVKINVVAKKIPVITWTNPADIIDGTLLSATQLNAKADVTGTFVYTPAIGTKLNVGTSQDLKVDFTPTDAVNYGVVSKIVKINVIAKKAPVITWTNPADITDGTLLSATQLNAKADVAGTFAYTPAIGTKLNVGSSQDLKVDFTPTDAVNYGVVSKIVKINVIAKKVPVITWANPTDISDGTLLSTTQLNATADVAGTFVYTPAIGSKLNNGANQDLTVEFTPTDIANYSKVSKTVKINVTSLIAFNPSLTYGTMTDQEGNVYKTITIGRQTWMAENLRTTIYRDGTAIPNVTDNTTWSALTTGAFCTYNNTTDAITIATYGRLYNWYAATNSHNIAPLGWHVPSDAEWLTLNNYLGDDVAGAKMKETGKSHWLSPSGSETNESGFTALPSGFRDYTDGKFIRMGDYCQYWQSTGSDASKAYYCQLNNSYSYLFYTSFIEKTSGYGLRLIKD